LYGRRKGQLYGEVRPFTPPNESRSRYPTAKMRKVNGQAMRNAIPEIREKGKSYERRRRKTMGPKAPNTTEYTWI